jgi:hypothetical protein
VINMTKFHVRKWNILKFFMTAESTFENLYSISNIHLFHLLVVYI